MVEPIRPVDRRYRTPPPPIAPVRRVTRHDARDEEEQAGHDREPPSEQDGEDEPGAGHVDLLA